MNNTIKVILTALAVILVVSFAYKNFQGKSDAPGTTAVTTTTAPAPVPAAKDPAKPVREINPNKKLGPGGAVIRSFFKNWEYERFAEMYKQTVHSRTDDHFMKAMAKTPIHWQKLEILSEEPADDGWNVKLSLDVTDIVSAFAACMVNLTLIDNTEAEDWAFKFSPRELDIEQFMNVKQVWRVVKLNDQTFIDIGGGESAVERNSNIMNYILDAPVLTVPTSPPSGMPTTAKAMIGNLWIKIMRLDLDKYADDENAILIAVKPLSLKATENWLKLYGHRKTIRPQPQEEPTFE